MALFLKLVWSSWRIRCLVFLKFLVVPVLGKSFLNEGLEYGRLGCAFIAKFWSTSTVSVDVSLEKRIGCSVEKQVKMSCEGSWRKKYVQG